ncbi:MAG: hypothetical protein LH465_04785, partial [Sphingomonas bacterium]|nr:hypothetical protein [Sphingomonas bacterium]
LFQGKKPDIPFVDPASVKKAKREETGKQDRLLRGGPELSAPDRHCERQRSHPGWREAGLPRPFGARNDGEADVVIASASEAIQDGARSGLPRPFGARNDGEGDVVIASASEAIRPLTLLDCRVACGSSQ